MAKLPSLFSLAGVLVLTAIPGFASETTYHDPRNPSFSLVVPDGWTAKRTDSGVSLNHGNSSAILMAITGNRSATDMLEDIVGQMQKQAREFRPMDKGACRFGGQQGAYSQFSSVGPNGTAEVVKVIAMTNGQLVYLMIQETQPGEYEDNKNDLQRIQDSFAPEALPAAVDDREKLDALYAAGVISQQEYEARTKNLGGSASSRPPPAVNTGNSGSSAPNASPVPAEPPLLAQPNSPGAGRTAEFPSAAQAQRYVVVHFALSTTMNWLTDNCMGWMTIENGVISYRAVKGNHGLHSFDIPLASIKEAKRNAMMGSAYQAFHIRLKTGENYDFSLLDSTGQQILNPEVLLSAIHAAMQ
ncbi:MAG TPA: SHOCT domain-containing protein [Terracidiphilus sp.]|nr:SHOCT domain-containing protein [Terracidiphilus sp.]